MKTRNSTTAVNVGNVTIGGGAPVVVQAMTNTDTADAEATAFLLSRVPMARWGEMHEIRDLPEWHEENGRTAVPLAFAPRQSWFVVFRRKAEGGGLKQQKNFPKLQPIAAIAGPWQVSFDPKWGGPGQATFETLADWTKRPEDGIRYYSGTAVYRKQFRLPASVPGRRLLLDLGTVKNVARVKVNGRNMGVVWTAPWRVEITGAVRQGANGLEIEVANLWPNRLIGDATLPKDRRFTETNVRTYDTMASGTYGCPKCRARKKSGQPAALLSSGLLGPVTLQRTADE